MRNPEADRGRRHGPPGRRRIQDRIDVDPGAGTAGDAADKVLASSAAASVTASDDSSALTSPAASWGRATESKALLVNIPYGERVLLASPRGYCAGVERAVETVERALELYGPPVYVRKQIVHNAHVVRELEARGAMFVESESEVPAGRDGRLLRARRRPERCTRTRHARAADDRRDVPARDEGARRSAPLRGRGYTIVLIGHAGHEEVVGTIGEAPDAIVLVESVEDAETLDSRRTRRLAYITQTTLSVDETGEIIAVLRRRFPQIGRPKKEDICYATSNRQWAVKEMLERGRPAARDRLAEQLELEPARRGRPRGRGVACVPDRRRDGDRRGVARRRRETRRADVGRVGARAARRGRVCDWFAARAASVRRSRATFSRPSTRTIDVQARRSSCARDAAHAWRERRQMRPADARGRSRAFSTRRARRPYFARRRRRATSRLIQLAVAASRTRGAPALVRNA